MTNELNQDTNKSPLLWIIGLIILLVVLFLLTKLFTDKQDVVLEDNTPTMTNDNVITNTPVTPVVTEYNEVSITEVISDRMFKARTSSGETFTFYLDDSLDLNKAEFKIVMVAGEKVTVKGMMTDDLSNQTLEKDESNVVTVEQEVFLVSDIR